MVGDVVGPRGGGHHDGIDWKRDRSKHHQTILAAADGILLASYKSDTYGNVKEIGDGKGGITIYAHMDELSPMKVGDFVAKGQPIGQMGNTGRSHGEHLHFEYLPDGVCAAAPVVDGHKLRRNETLTGTQSDAEAIASAHSQFTQDMATYAANNPHKKLPSADVDHAHSQALASVKKKSHEKTA